MWAPLNTLQKRNVDKSHVGPAQPKVGSPRAWITPRPGPDQGEPGRSPGCREGSSLLAQPSSRADCPPVLHQHRCPKLTVFSHRLLILTLNLGNTHLQQCASFGLDPRGSRLSTPSPLYPSQPQLLVSASLLHLKTKIHLSTTMWQQSNASQQWCCSACLHLQYWKSNHLVLLETYLPFELACFFFFFPIYIGSAVEQHEAARF